MLTTNIIPCVMSHGITAAFGNTGYHPSPRFYPNSIAITQQPQVILNMLLKSNLQSWAQSPGCSHAGLPEATSELGRDLGPFRQAASRGLPINKLSMPYRSDEANINSETVLCHLRLQHCTTVVLSVPVFLVKPVASLLLFISKQTHTM